MTRPTLLNASSNFAVQVSAIPPLHIFIQLLCTNVSHFVCHVFLHLFCLGKKKQRKREYKDIYGGHCVMFAMPKGRGSHKNFEDLDALELKYDPDNKGKPPREKPEIAWFFTKGGLSPPQRDFIQIPLFSREKARNRLGVWSMGTPHPLVWQKNKLYQLASCAGLREPSLQI